MPSSITPPVGTYIINEGEYSIAHIYLPVSIKAIRLYAAATTLVDDYITDEGESSIAHIHLPDRVKQVRFFSPLGSRLKITYATTEDQFPNQMAKAVATTEVAVSIGGGGIAACGKGLKAPFSEVKTQDILTESYYFALGSLSVLVPVVATYFIFFH